LISASGLRGRGGAGFPTGLKWRLAREAKADRRYLICNGDEGDPGAYMDRGLLESNPFRVLEGMIIGGYALGAEKGFIYIRQEYPLAIEKIEQAIGILKETGFLGKGILGTDFSFDLELVRGAGAFVCGEETALIASIEGRRPFPRQKPPFPVIKGLWGKPTVINNVETWANIPLIIDKGPDWFSALGTEKVKGLKFFFGRSGSLYWIDRSAARLNYWRNHRRDWRRLKEWKENKSCPDWRAFWWLSSSQ
jgi:NADH:ubiquinone oxidoreductase, NADH-binding (51 kD) subunit